MSAKSLSIVSPVNGKAILLENVPDDVFSQKILGDGCAVIPSDGSFVCPVDGEVVSVADSLHAIGFVTDDDVELLIHIGIDTVKLEGQGFKVHVKAGDKVKKGDPAVEVDLELLKAKGLNTVTPVIICGGADELHMTQIEGEVKAGKTELLKLSAEDEQTDDSKVEANQIQTVKEAKKTKGKLNFDFL